jgi:hypothetical protein
MASIIGMKENEASQMHLTLSSSTIFEARLVRRLPGKRPSTSSLGRWGFDAGDVDWYTIVARPREAPKERSELPVYGGFVQLVRGETAAKPAAGRAWKSVRIWGWHVDTLAAPNIAPESFEQA